MNRGECVGAIVCKLDYHKKIYKRGYIAMLAVDKNFRKRKIGSTLVKKAIDAMIGDDADEVSIAELLVSHGMVGNVFSTAGRPGDRDYQHAGAPTVREPGLRQGQEIV